MLILREGKMDKFDDIRSHVYVGDIGPNEIIDERVWEDIRNKEPVYSCPSIEILASLTFNEHTKWDIKEYPKKILEYGKKPPLDISKLHDAGIDGRGVNVAIIDQPLALNHPEYKGKIASYKTFAPAGYEMPLSSMHGPAVTSLLVGENLGTAPKAKVYYYAFPSWLRDSLYAAQALEDIIDTNKTLSDREKIKFVSVSASLSGKNSPFIKNHDAWDKAFEKAKEAGICVVDCTRKNGFILPGYVDFTDQTFKFGFPDRPVNKPYGEVHVPNSIRTVAESYDNQHFTYAYWGVGGLSWGIPYATGLLCLGQQLNPDLPAEELKRILIETAVNNNNIISPIDFVEKVKMQGKLENSNEKNMTL